MALNGESMLETYSYPPLTDADYLTSSRMVSRKPSRRDSRSPLVSANGPAFGDANDDKLSVDPRRFTPTLHASLVAEILGLRRELESKNSLVVNLEEHTAQMKEENTKLHELIAANSKEKRTLKRQLDTLEHGTLAAIEEIAKERDRAQEAVSEVRSKLEATRNKVRNQEEESQRTQKIWHRDQEKWETERRVLERKVHVIEGRLKTVLAEVASAQPSVQPRRSIETPSSWARDRPSSRASGGRRSAASHHRNSFSNGTSVGSKTLADELNFESISDGESDECGSPAALPEEMEYPRSFSAQSNRQSVKARKLLGLHIDAAEALKGIRDHAPTGNTPVADIFPIQQPKGAYNDMATQYSPPPSPKLSAEQQRLSTITEIDGDSMLDETGIRSMSVDYNKFLRPTSMVSSGSQTMETPLSPPETPVHSRSEMIESKRISTSTTSTQTYENLFSATIGSLSTIPVIAIHPVRSETGEVIPPNARHASTQAHIIGEVTSRAVQTENIRTDERLTKLPAYLHPAIILPVSPSPSPTPDVQHKKHLRASSGKLTLQIPGQRSTASRSILRKPSDQLEDQHSEDDVSDDSFLNKEPIKKVLSKVQDSWQLIASPIEDIENVTDTEENAPKLPEMEFSEFDLRHTNIDPDSPSRKQRPRKAQTQDQLKVNDPANGIRTRIGRNRSPSEPARPDASNGLPFPVPDRSSSRKFPWLTDDGLDSPTLRPGKYIRGNRPLMKKRGIRKTRSEIGEHGYSSRARSPSPQPFDLFTDGLGNIPPPLPENEITTPRSATVPHNRMASNSQSIPSQPESARSDQTTVVDSIAQTMIGEWMYKYVRRRKSFGLPDEPGTGENSVNGGVRHQRWVWVAPYERAVMWSSKQPTSGTALMGKNGRKLVISSVLDVRDDTPMPKGAPSTSHFGRSILILTPQRALKFTANSLDRHHVWMSALSFLSQGPVDFADIVEQHPIAPPLANQNSSRGSMLGHRAGKPSLSGSLHRSKIHDSIRIAKGKERPSPGQRANTNPVSLPSQQGEPDDYQSLGAEAPCVPRTSADTRRRSNTTSRSGNSSLRSHGSSHKPSLHSLRSREPSSAVEAPRSSLRLWPKPQRVVSENATSREASRATSRQSNTIESENLFEAVGTMRMSAFVHDNKKKSTPNHESTSKRMPLGVRSISTNDADTHYTTDAPSRRRPNRPEDGHRTKLQHHSPVLNEEETPDMPRPSLTSGGRDPFEGF